MSKGYQLKITIKGSKPPIWRRVIVPERITFYQLDDIIEELFGWTHSHLFEFYITKLGSRFMGGILDDMDDADDADECIDPWIEVGDKFLYTYDFGDDWEHDIQIEKLVEYPHRYPTVLKYKGANMIEDCGGIWGYEECKNEAEPFDMEKVNEMFQSWEIPVAELSEYEEDEFWYEDDEEDDISLFDMFSEDFEEKLEEVMQLRQELEEESRNYFGEIERLEDILSQYTKNDLLSIAKQLGLINYGKWKKADFLREVLKKLLQIDCMQKMIEEAEQDEVELFEGAIEENGICISKEVVEDSWLLCCYGAFIEEAEFYLVPLDVQKLYQKAMTPEFRRGLEDEAEFKSICDSALYLYGVISLSKFTEIYNVYAQTPLSEATIIKKLKIYKKENTDIVISGDYLLHRMLWSEDLYKDVLEFQDNIEPYLPQDKKEFFEYGEYSPKAWKKAETMINRFAKCVRKWDFCGHTFYEINQQNKIIEFPTKSKIYPNDPCPCGSGKKYKHCCARK